MSAPTLFRKYLPRHILVDVARTGFGDKLSLDPDAAECFAPTLPTLKEMRNSVVAKAEKEYLRELMVFTEGNIDLACRISDLKRARLYELLKKRGVS